MAYLTKANVGLIRELEGKVTDVLKSFAYEEILADGILEITEVLYPFRCYKKGKCEISALMLGENSYVADCEIMAIAINSMLACEMENFTLKLGHGKLSCNVSGSVSALENADLDCDEADDILSICDLLDGYGLADFLSVDLNQGKDFDGVYFTCFSGEKRIMTGGRKGTNLELNIDLKALSEIKTGNTELKDPVPVVLVASDFSETAYKVAFGMRRQGLKVEGYVSGGSMTDAEEYCNLKGIPTMVWAGEEKVVMKNIRTSETAETTIEKLLGTDK